MARVGGELAAWIGDNAVGTATYTPDDGVDAVMGLAGRLALRAVSWEYPFPDPDGQVVRVVGRDFGALEDNFEATFVIQVRAVQ